MTYIVKNGETVKQPKHYKGKSGIEVIDVFKDFVGDLQGESPAYFYNVIKYVLRFQQKNGVEDLEKALVNLEWLINAESTKKEL